MNIEQLIQSIPDWQTLSDAQIWEALNDKSIKKVDQKKWRSIDLAKLIGWDQVDDFFAYLRENKCEWVVALAGSDGLEIGDDPVNAVLASFDHPVCKQLAYLGIHYVSMLEDADIETTQEIIECMVSGLHTQQTLATTKQQWLQEGAARWNAFVVAVDAYTSGPKPEL